MKRQRQGDDWLSRQQVQQLERRAAQPGFDDYMDDLFDPQAQLTRRRQQQRQQRRNRALRLVGLVVPEVGHGPLAQTSRAVATDVRDDANDAALRGAAEYVASTGRSDPVSAPSNDLQERIEALEWAAVHPQMGDLQRRLWYQDAELQAYGRRLALTMHHTDDTAGSRLMRICLTHPDQRGMCAVHWLLGGHPHSAGFAGPTDPPTMTNLLIQACTRALPRLVRLFAARLTAADLLPAQLRHLVAPRMPGREAALRLLFQDELVWSAAQTTAILNFAVAGDDLPLVQEVMRVAGPGRPRPESADWKVVRRAVDRAIGTAVFDVQQTREWRSVLRDMLQNGQGRGAVVPDDLQEWLTIAAAYTRSPTDPETPCIEAATRLLQRVVGTPLDRHLPRVLELVHPSVTYIMRMVFAAFINAYNDDQALASGA
jgi:hypothetical protein